MNLQIVWIRAGEKTKPSRAIWLRRCCAIVEVGTSRQTALSFLCNAERSASRIVKVLPEPAGPVSNRM